MYQRTYTIKEHDALSMFSVCVCVYIHVCVGSRFQLHLTNLESSFLSEEKQFPVLVL